MHSATTAAPASAAAIPVVPERADWPAVAAAGLSTFCVVTSEMLPVGLLAPIADELGMSTGMGGLLLFVPSLLAALCAPLAVLWAGGADRRRVLCALLAALALANAASALAPNLPAGGARAGGLLHRRHLVHRRRAGGPPGAAGRRGIGRP